MQLVECFERYDLTYQAILRTLQQDSKVRGIYMGTESVPACMDAIKKAGLKYKVHVVANDLTQPAIRGLQNGLLDFVVEQDFSAQAYEAILILYALLAHNRSPKSPLIIKAPSCQRALLRFDYTVCDSPNRSIPILPAIRLAAAILSASPGRNGSTHMLSAGTSATPPCTIYHAVPKA